MNWSLLLSGLKSPSTPGGRRSRRILVALLIYTIVGFFIAPAIIKWQLVKRLPGLTHRQAAVQKVKLNPYALSLTVRGLSLTETNGEPFAGFDELYVNFQLSSLFRWTWTFSRISLTHPTANFVRDANGQLNFANLFAGATNTPPPPPAATNRTKSLPAVLVQHLVVTNGHVTVTDQTRAKPFLAEYGPMDLDLQDFTTRRNRNEPYAFMATTGDGESFSWSGKISVNPPRSTGEFKLLGIPLKKYSPYLAEFARFQVAGGVLDVSAAYRLDAAVRPLELEVTNVAVKLAGLQVQSPDADETLLTMKDFAVTGAFASLAAREARVPLVAVRGGAALARRNADGQLNWLALLVTRTNEPVDAVAADTHTVPVASTPWKVFLEQFDVENFNLTAEDRATPTPAQLGLDDLRLNVKGVSNQSNAPVTAAISFNWRGGGTVRVEANGTLLPPSGAAKLAIANLALPPVQPYVEQQARLVLNAGELSVNAQAHYSPGQARTIGFSGDVSVAKFAALDTVAYHDFARWDNLSLRGLQVSLQTNSLNVDEIKFTSLETSLVVSSNGQLNVLALSRKETAAAAGGASTNAVSPQPVAGAEAFPIRIGALVFEKSSFRAADQSLTPRFNTRIEEFDGTIRDLTLPGLTRAGVDIHGKVSAVAPFEIVGAILPDAKNPFVDLKLAFTNSDLTPFDPYSAKFVGRPLNKGKLTFELRYNIEDRKVKAANVITLDQLTFGARNQSTNATKLPVKLAVALLKDREGRIDLDLPVSGSLDDPEFRIGALVWKAIVNILVKVATSPFSLLGAMFGGGEELQFVDFAPGSATLAEAQTNKLDKLSKALYERPALSLEIAASADPVADRDALSLRKLRDQMQSLRIQELTARGKPLPAGFKFEDGDYEDLLRKTYKEAFNTTPERALREARAAAAATNAAAGAKTNELASAMARTDPIKGASQLLQHRPGAPAGELTSTNAAPGSGLPPAKPKTEAELVREELQRRLMEKSPATDDDLRELMQHRAETVQKFLLDTGRVTADRLFLVAPKPADPAVKGEARATFSLD
jgi:ribosomal protein S11